MSSLRLSLLLAPLVLAACGSETTYVYNPPPQTIVAAPAAQPMVVGQPGTRTVVTPQPGQAVMVPPNSQVRVCAAGTVC